MMVLLAIDDDQASRHAAYATAAWLPEGSHVVALHVKPTALSLGTPIPPGVGLAGPGYAMHLTSALPSDDELQAIAQDVAAKALEHRPGSVRVERGDPAATICQVAEEIEADLIVLGTGDRSWIDRLFNPSVSASVATDAPCSVLIARPTTHGPR